MPQLLVIKKDSRIFEGNYNLRKLELESVLTIAGHDGHTECFFLTIGGKKCIEVWGASRKLSGWFPAPSIRYGFLSKREKNIKKIIWVS